MKIRASPSRTPTNNGSRSTRLGTTSIAISLAGDVRLTMGGEPTFVSIDDMEGAEWNTAAVGPNKASAVGRSADRRLQHRFARADCSTSAKANGIPANRCRAWALRCYWRRDGQPLWSDESLFADPTPKGEQTVDDARRFGQAWLSVWA